MLCMANQSLVGLSVRVVSFTRSDRVVLPDELVRRYSVTRGTSKRLRINPLLWVYFVRLWKRKRTKRFTERTPTVELRFHVLFLHWKQKTIALHCVWYTSDPRCCRQCQRNNNVVRRWSGEWSATLVFFFTLFFLSLSKTVFDLCSDLPLTFLYGQPRERYVNTTSQLRSGSMSFLCSVFRAGISPLIVLDIFQPLNRVCRSCIRSVFKCVIFLDHRRGSFEHVS